MKLKIYSQFDSELCKKWLELESNATITVFQTFYFQKIWSENIGKRLKKNIHIFVFENNQEVIAIYPLQLSSLILTNVINFLASEQSDYTGPLLNNKHLKIIDYDYIWWSIFSILGKNNIYSFDKVPIEPDLLSIGQFNKFTIAGVDKSHALNFNENYKLSNISDLKRQIRKLSVMGRLKFKILKQNQIDFDQNYSDFTVMKNKRLGQQNKRQLFSVDGLYDFYLDLLVNSKTSQVFKIYSLHFDDKVVASCLSAVLNGRYYYLIPAYRIGYLNFSWGSILIYYLIRFSKKTGLKSFDMTLGGEAYKQNYCNSTINLVSYFYSDNFFLNYYLTYKMLKIKLKKNNSLVNLLNNFGIK